MSKLLDSMTRDELALRVLGLYAALRDGEEYVAQGRVDVSDPRFERLRAEIDRVNAACTALDALTSQVENFVAEPVVWGESLVARGRKGSIPITDLAPWDGSKPDVS